MTVIYKDNNGNVLGSNSADNKFDSSGVAGNDDGSIIERLEALLVDITAIDGFADVPTADSAANSTSRDVIGNKTDTVAGNSLIALLKQLIVDVTGAVTEPPTAKSLHDILHKDGSYTFDNTTDSLEALADSLSTIDTVVDAIKAVTDYETLIATKSISSIVSGDTNLFDLTGEVEIQSIVGVVTTATEDSACTYKFDFYDGTTETDLCTATSVQNKAIGTNLSITGTVANALVVTAGNVSAGQAGKLVLSDGGDTGNGKIRGVSDAAITGVITFIVKYKKLSSDGLLTASA